MTITMTTHATRTYIFGSIWPLGREHAADEAQIRQCERDVAALHNVTNNGEAA